MKLRFSHLLSLWLLGSALCACRQQQQPLIQIDTHQITLAQFRQELKPLQAELVQLPTEQQKLLLRQVLSQLIDQELLLAEAQQDGIKVSDEELELAIQELRGDYSAAEYQEILRNSGQDPDQWRQQLRIRLLSAKVATRITQGKIKLDKTQIEEFYLQHLDDYRRPEELQARQILLTTLEEATSLRNRLLSGESFAALAQRYSSSPERINGGELDLFSRGQFPPEVDAELFALKPGQISQPLKSPYGIHLLLVEKRFNARVLPLAEVEASIIKILTEQEETRLYQQWLGTQREHTEVQIDWEQLDKLHFDKAE